MCRRHTQLKKSRIDSEAEAEEDEDIEETEPWIFSTPEPLQAERRFDRATRTAL